jgi:predicted nucleotide-binding protein
MHAARRDAPGWGLHLSYSRSLRPRGKTNIEKLEKYISVAHFGVVLATPDDEGHRAGHPDEKRFRVQQNVALELGGATGAAPS